jgi:hypothetical protein
MIRVIKTVMYQENETSEWKLGLQIINAEHKEFIVDLKNGDMPEEIWNVTDAGNIKLVFR